MREAEWRRGWLSKRPTSLLLEPGHKALKAAPGSGTAASRAWWRDKISEMKHEKQETRNENESKRKGLSSMKDESKQKEVASLVNGEVGIDEKEVEGMEIRGLKGRCSQLESARLALVSVVQGN
jgi:hypothetical protein